MIFSSASFCRQQPSGNLFVIDGGERPAALMRKLIRTAQITKSDYVVVLPMSGTDLTLAKYPSYTCIDINEAMAIIIHGKKVEMNGQRRWK
jgi:hypothetical protein